MPLATRFAISRDPQPTLCSTVKAHDNRMNPSASGYIFSFKACRWLLSSVNVSWSNGTV